MPRLTLLLFAFLLVGMTHAQQEEPDSLLQLHFQSAGQPILDTMQTMIITGKVGDGVQSPTFRKIHKRPDKFLLEVDLGDSKIIRAFDGEKGWTLNPLAGIETPLFLEGEDLKQLIEQGRFDLHLYCASKEGRSIEYQGTETYEDKLVHVLKVEDFNGYDVYQFMDDETHLIVKSEGVYKTGNQMKPGKTLFKDIQKTDGIAFPHYIDIVIDGRSFIKYDIDTVEYNVPVPDSIFTAPVH